MIPFLVLYNMSIGLEAIYLGYLYSVVFWVRILANIFFVIVDLWFLTMLMDYRNLFDIKLLYGAAGCLLFIWVVLGIFVLIKYRFGKVKKVEISKIKLLAALGIMALKGLATVAISVVWRYFLYDAVYTITELDVREELSRTRFENFGSFLFVIYSFNIFSSVVYLFSLRYVSLRFLAFGHFSGKYSLGFIFLRVGDIIDGLLGLVLSYRLTKFFDDIGSSVFLGTVNALQGLNLMTIVSLWLMIFANGMQSYFNIGTAAIRSKSSYEKKSNDSLQEDIESLKIEENEDNSNDKCYGKPECQGRPIWYVLPCYHNIYCARCVNVSSSTSSQ